MFFRLCHSVMSGSTDGTKSMTPDDKINTKTQMPSEDITGAAISHLHQTTPVIQNRKKRKSTNQKIADESESENDESDDPTKRFTWEYNWLRRQNCKTVGHRSYIETKKLQLIEQLKFISSQIYDLVGSDIKTLEAAYDLEPVLIEITLQSKSNKQDENILPSSVVWKSTKRDAELLCSLFTYESKIFQETSEHSLKQNVGVPWECIQAIKVHDCVTLPKMYKIDDNPQHTAVLNNVQNVLDKIRNKYPDAQLPSSVYFIDDGFRFSLIS